MNSVPAEAWSILTRSNSPVPESSRLDIDRSPSPCFSHDSGLSARGPEKDLRRTLYDADDSFDDEEKPLTGSAPMSRTASGSTRPQQGGGASFLFWVIVNIVATLVIILANKHILSNPTLKGAPTLFVAYHFALTALTLHIASSSAVGAFERKPISPFAIAPLVVVFAAHTVVTNASLVCPFASFLTLDTKLKNGTGWAGSVGSAHLSANTHPRDTLHCSH